MNWKKLFKIQMIFSIIYWTIYFYNAFYQWDLYNPFWWALELPYDEHLRFTVLFLGTCILCLWLPLYKVFLNEDGTFKKNP